MQYTDGHIYGLTLDASQYNQYGVLNEYLYNTDTSTGETTVETLDANTNLNLAAFETAQASDGTVYGEFYNSDGSALEWGTVDYATKTRITIAPARHFYVALGITNEGQLYGVASDGNLYRIDKSTGAETEVGSTGVSVSDGNDNYYGQTGEIDLKDNTFYWAAISLDEAGNAQGGLYEVNLQTGAATLISSGNNQVYGMIIPQADAQNGAPAKVSDAALNFEGASLTGTVSFTAPTTTYGGDNLTGDLTYTIKANDQVVATGTTTPGAAVSTDVTLPANGYYNFVITTSNGVGESPSTKLTKWIGYDVPLPVTGLEVSSEGGNVYLSWNAPQGGVHDGVLGDVTYDVYRISNTDTVLVTSGISATQYIDELDNSALAYYSYAVRAKAGGMESELVVSDNGVIAGKSIEPDWTEEFNNATDFDLFTVVDANNDGKTWRYNKYNHYAYSNNNKNNGNDDWLFTPPLHLNAGRLYTVAFKARNGSSRWHNTLEVKWGDDTTAEAMTNTLLETTDVDPKYTVFTYDIKPTADGEYYIGFHDNTADADQFYITLDSIVVTKSSVGFAPRAVTGLTVTPAERGALSATLSFTTPSLDVDGNAINQVDSIQILRDGVLAATLPSAVAGSEQTFVDSNVPSNGLHKYEVVPYIRGEFGLKANASAFIGQDIPTTPQNIILLDNGSNMLSTWDAFADKGPNGGYVNPENVAVSFFKVVDGGLYNQVGDSITSSEKGATRASIPLNPEESVNADGHTQSVLTLAARADADGGSSRYVVAGPLIVGPSLQLPYKESFVGGNVDNGLLWADRNEQVANNSEAAMWQFDTEHSADGDGGSVVWRNYTESYWYGSFDYTITPGDEASVNSPKVSLQGASNPKLFFKLYTTEADSADLEVKVFTPDGVEHTVKTYDLLTTPTGTWTTQEIDLKQFASQRYIILRFNGVAKGSGTYIGIDDINVFDQLQYNVAATDIKAPEEITAGKTGYVSVTVENYGAQPATGFDVVLYANDEPVDTATVSKNLNVLDKDTVSLSFPVAINRTEDVKLKAVVVYPNDLDEDDNTTDTKTVKVNASQYPKVDGLKAEAATEGVDLSWPAPVIPAPQTVTEDFESYAPFATSLGDWTLVDGDKGLAGQFFQTVSYPGQGTAFAFEAFNPEEITTQFDVLEQNPGITPYSGNQYAAAPFATNGNGSIVDADNWLISPLLSGKKQTISFYALNVAGDDGPYAETFDVLYSTTGKDTADFVNIESDVANGTTPISQGANWTEYSVELPEGAKYFAIHHTSTVGNNFLFGLDDITYENGSVGANDSIIAYNVYRDGEFIGSVKGDVLVFTDAIAAEGDHVYNVTAVFQDAQGNVNESGFSNDASITVTGIDGVVANEEGSYNVYTIDGKTVMLNAKSLKGLKSGLYIINDRKYIIK